MRILTVTIADDTAARLAARGVDGPRLGKALDRMLLQRHGSQSVFGAANETIAEETLLSLPEVSNVETLNEMKDVGDFLVNLHKAPEVSLVLENKTGQYHADADAVVAYVNKTHGEATDRLYTASDLSVVTVPVFIAGEWKLLCALASEVKRSKKHPMKIQQKQTIAVSKLDTSGYPWSTDVAGTLRRAAFELALRQAQELTSQVVELSS
jgi:hypothetical protein